MRPSLRPRLCSLRLLCCPYVCCWRRLSRWPVKPSPAQKMYMQMIYRLPGIIAAIYNGAIALFRDAFRSGNFGGYFQELAQHFRGGILDSGDMFFGYDQYMSRSLRVIVMESENIIILVNFPPRPLTFNNFAKYTIRHGVIIYRAGYKGQATLLNHPAG